MRVAPGIPFIMLGCFRLANFPVAMLSASIHRITLLPCDQSAQVPVHATMSRLGVAAPYSAPRGLFDQEVLPNCIGARIRSYARVIPPHLMGMLQTVQIYA